MTSSSITGHIKLGAYERASLLLIRTITPLHIGVGRTVGVVDLPIVRDALGFPVIPTSSLKGALRSQLKDSGALSEDDVKILFGPEPGEEAYAGAVAFTDGYLLAIPARSLRGIWALVTSPILIHRFLRILQMTHSLESSKKELEELKKLAEKLLGESEAMEVDQALVCKDCKKRLSIEITGKESIIVNEEFQFECKQSENLKGFFERINIPEAWRVVLIHDDRIRDVIERSILRRARVRLKEDKTVGEGPWSEEDLPADTFFFNVLFYSKPRSPQRSQEKMNNAEDVRNKVIKTIFTDYNQKRGYAIFGGHETIGRGIVELIGLVGCPP